MTTKTSTKRPSAAEQARREAQSAVDRGEVKPLEVSLWGVTVQIPQERFDDLSYTANLLRMDDESLDAGERTKAAVSVAMHMCADKFDEVVAAYRREHEGSAPISACGEIVAEIFGQINPESQAS